MNTEGMVSLYHTANINRILKREEMRTENFYFYKMKNTV